MTKQIDLSNKVDVAAASDAQFAEAVQSKPWAALQYEHACARLSDAQFADAVKAYPWPALAYEHAWARLSDEQFAAVVKDRPDAALRYEHAFVRLSDAQFAEVVTRLDDEDYEVLCKIYHRIAERHAQVATAQAIHP